MQAVILCAGMGQRLSPLTDNLPKCLLMVGEKTILQRAIDNLVSYGITEILFVVGFQHEQIQRYVLRAFPNINATFITNEHYATTNNAYSLLLVKDHIKGDFFLLDGDIVFDGKVLAKLQQSPNKPSLALGVHECGDEEIKVELGEYRAVLSIGKTVPILQTAGESVGIEYIDHKTGLVLFKTLTKRVIVENKVNEFYEASFNEMCQTGHVFYAVDIENLLAIEIDSQSDYNEANKLVVSYRLWEEKASFPK